MDKLLQDYNVFQDKRVINIRPMKIKEFEYYLAGLPDGASNAAEIPIELGANVGCAQKK